MPHTQGQNGSTAHGDISSSSASPTVLFDSADDGVAGSIWVHNNTDAGLFVRATPMTGDSTWGRIAPGASQPFTRILKAGAEHELQKIECYKASPTTGTVDWVKEC